MAIADNISTGSSDFTINEDAERRVITEVTRTEFLDGGNGPHGTFDAYHTIEEYSPGTMDGQPRRQIVHHQGYLEYPNQDYGQDDRSIESYHTNEHRVYEQGPNGAIEYRSESRHR